MSSFWLDAPLRPARGSRSGASQRGDVLVYLAAERFLDAPLVPPGHQGLDERVDETAEVGALLHREARRIAQSIDWASTLLLPIPREMVVFNEVVVDGVNGVALESLDGTGGTLLWQKDGKVYMLNSAGSVEDLLSIVAGGE